VILATVLIYFAFFKKPGEVAVSPTPTPTKMATPDWKVYQNTDYGFQLTLTDAWKGYYVRKSPGVAYYGDGSKIVNTVRLDFIIPTSDSGCNDSPGKFSILPLSVFTRDSWQKYSSDPIGAKRVLGQNSSYVFAYTSPQCYPSDIDPKINEFAIEKVLSSFRLTND
jgi:hypothetical protein